MKHPAAQNDCNGLYEPLHAMSLSVSMSPLLRVRRGNFFTGGTAVQNIAPNSIRLHG